LSHFKQKSELLTSCFLSARQGPNGKTNREIFKQYDEGKIKVHRTPKPKAQTPNFISESLRHPNPKLKLPNPEPQTPNPKPSTPNPQPQTSNPHLENTKTLNKDFQTQSPIHNP
jgi:hypothetical protein